MTAILALDSIEFSFGDRAVLRSAYLDALAGTVTALIGRSGTGKTTLFRVLEGSLRPAAGTVRWDGVPIARVRPEELARRGLASLPSGTWLPDHLPAGELVGMLAGVWGGRAADVLAEAGIGAVVDRPTASLSGGERRMAEITVALAARPSVLVLDEPFRGLAPVHRNALGVLLRRRASEGMAVLFADHDVVSVLEYADRVFSLAAGRTRLVSGFRERPVTEWYELWPSGPG
ncbi:MAG: ATP-binding cassette domain-containing protein [Gemmatimonadales bacterium]